MKAFIFICYLLLLACNEGFSQQSSSLSPKCKQDLEIVEKAFSAFAADSIRKPGYYLNALKAADNFLKNCGVSDETKKIIGIKKTILDLYARNLPYHSEYRFYKKIASLENSPQLKKSFKKEIDSLKNSTDPALQQYILYLKGIIYTTTLDDHA